MSEIIDGFLKFQRDVFPRHAALFGQLATRQAPKTLFISCSDSRLVPELVTQRDPGDLFVIRNAGNIVPPYGPEPGGVSASVEYAVCVLGVSDIVICGHSDCGAMTAIAHHACLDHMPAVASWLRHADAARNAVETRKLPTADARVQAMVSENVIAQLANISTHPSVRRALDEGWLNLHGWLYDIRTGGIDAFDSEAGTFLPLAEHYAQAMPAATAVLP